MHFCMERNFTLNPSIDKLYETLIHISAKTKNWNQLIQITEKAFSNKIINKELYQENKSIGYYEIASIRSYSDIKEAIKNITKAIDLKSNFSPFISYI